MLFEKKTPLEKMEKEVKKGRWYELSEYADGSKEEKIDLAKALAGSDNENSVEILMRLIDDNNDDEVVTAACESLKKVGSEHNTADLLEKLNSIPKEKEKIREEISSTVQQLHHRVLFFLTAHLKS